MTARRSNPMPIAKLPARRRMSDAELFGEQPMTTFREGQEVEVFDTGCTAMPNWRKAKIVREPTTTALADKPLWQVQFPNGTRAVIDGEHIRPIPWSLDDPEIRKSLQLDGWSP